MRTVVLSSAYIGSAALRGRRLCPFTPTQHHTITADQYVLQVEIGRSGRGLTRFHVDRDGGVVISKFGAIVEEAEAPITQSRISMPDQLSSFIQCASSPQPTQPSVNPAYI